MTSDSMGTIASKSGISFPFALVGASGFLLATAVAEEHENLARFGAAYSAYLKVTKRFVPYVF